MKVRGIYCLNSKCVNYFEDNCIKILETDTVNIDEEGKCCDFKLGQHIGYQGDNEESELNSSMEMIEKAKSEIKDNVVISVNTLKHKLKIGIVKANLLVEDLKNLGVIREYSDHKDVYEVMKQN